MTLQQITRNAALKAKQENESEEDKGEEVARIVEEAVTIIYLALREETGLERITDNDGSFRCRTR